MASRLSVTSSRAFEPEPSFVSTEPGRTRAKNRSAILCVSRQWREVGSIILRRSLDFNTWAVWDKVDSWVAYADREREADSKLSLVNNLWLSMPRDPESWRVLGRVREVRNLTYDEVCVGAAGLQIPAYWNGEGFTALEGTLVLFGLLLSSSADGIAELRCLNIRTISFAELDALDELDDLDHLSMRPCWWTFFPCVNALRVLHFPESGQR